MKIREIVLKGNDFYSMTGIQAGGESQFMERIAHKTMDDKRALEAALPFCDFIF